MRKSDVVTRWEGGRELPAVNVKVRPCADKREGYSDEDADTAFWGACEDGWSALDCEARSIFGGGVAVAAHGRSGGWAIVSGLPPVETWDAIMVSKWSRFARFAADTVKLVPDDMARLLADNYQRTT